MLRTPVVVLGVFSVMLAIGGSSQNHVCHGQDLRSVKRPADADSAQVRRPLPIEDADASIVEARIRGPVFAASNLFVGVEDPTSSFVKRHGDNRLEVRTRNVFEVDGPIVTAEVTCMPRRS